MRYAVYITRTEHWSFEARERRPITEAEWRAYAETDPELRPLLTVSCFDLHTGKKVGDSPIEKTWEWIVHPGGAHSAKRQTFQYNRGGIIVRAPDPLLLRKALAVANTLDAKVIGDDEEVIRDSAAG